MHSHDIDEIFDAFKCISRPEVIPTNDEPDIYLCEEIQQLLSMDLRTIGPHELIPYLAHVFVPCGSEADFLYLMPAMLSNWSELIDQAVEAPQDTCAYWFHAALARKDVLNKCLSPDQKKVVTGFMKRRLLEIISAQRWDLSSADEPNVPKWPSVFAFFGVISTDIPECWTRWWAMENEGHLISAVLWSSELICDFSANPLYARWRRERKNGWLTLWEMATEDFGSRWRAENLEFLQQTLTVKYLTERYDLATAKTNDPAFREAITKILAIMQNEPWRTINRIQELVEAFSTPELPLPAGKIDWTE